MGSCLSVNSDGSKRRPKGIPKIRPRRPSSGGADRETACSAIDNHNNSLRSSEPQSDVKRSSLSTTSGHDRPSSGRQKKLSICSTYSERLKVEVPPGMPEDTVLTVCDLYNVLNDGSLNAYIHEEGNFLVIDSRGKEEYEKSHIVTAKHSSELEEDRSFQSGMGYSWYNLIIIYGCSLKSAQSETLKSLWEEISMSVAGEVLVLSDGYDAFCQKFPFMCTDMVIRNAYERRNIITYPSTIINYKLYQGKGEQATNEKIIDDLKITHVINITKEHPNAFGDKLTYLRITVEDVKASDLFKYFQETCDFITKAFQKKGVVLIHCNLGVSRSSTITLAYLMQTQHISLEDALTFLRTRRSCARPNFGFLSQLAKWEEMILGKKVTTDIHNL